MNDDTSNRPPSLLTVSLVGQAAEQFAGEFLRDAYAKDSSPNAVLIGLLGAAELYAHHSGLKHNQVQAARYAAKKLKDLHARH